MKILEKLKNKPSIVKNFGIRQIHSIRESVSKSCIIYNENGIAKVDLTLKQLFLDLNLLIFAFELNVDELKSENGDFDIEKLCDIYDYMHFKTQIFKDTIKELKTMGVYIQEKIDDQVKEDLKYHNTIENLVCEKINLLITKIPDVQNGMSKLPEIMSKIDFDKINNTIENLNKVDKLKKINEVMNNK